MSITENPNFFGPPGSQKKISKIILFSVPKFPSNPVLSPKISIQIFLPVSGRKEIREIGLLTNVIYVYLNVQFYSGGGGGHVKSRG